MTYTHTLLKQATRFRRGLTFILLITAGLSHGLLESGDSTFHDELNVNGTDTSTLSSAIQSSKTGTLVPAKRPSMSFGNRISDSLRQVSPGKLYFNDQKFYRRLSGFADPNRFATSTQELVRFFKGSAVGWALGKARRNHVDNDPILRNAFFSAIYPSWLSNNGARQLSVFALKNGVEFYSIVASNPHDFGCQEDDEENTLAKNYRDMLKGALLNNTSQVAVAMGR